MKLIHCRNVPSMPNPHGVRASLVYDHPEAQVVYMELQPGEALKRHVTPVDVFFYVLEGLGTVEIGEEREKVGPDVLVESPAGIPHRLLNEGEGLFRVLVVKTPRPERKSKIL